MVNRGPSLASTSLAIVAAIEADARARLERDVAAQRQREEAWRAVNAAPPEHRDDASREGFGEHRT